MYTYRYFSHHSSSAASEIKSPEGLFFKASDTGHKRDLNQNRFLEQEACDHENYFNAVKGKSSNKNESKKSFFSSTISGSEQEQCSELEKSVQVENGKGHSLSGSIQSEMERKLGYNFSDVKIHTDIRASQLNNQLLSKAFTHGRDIYFKAGQYDPYTSEGKQLLAHELTHVQQQKSSNQTIIQRKLEVENGVELDMQGFTHTISGNIYSCPKVVKNSVWNEIFTSLLSSPRVFAIAGKTSEEANTNLLNHMAARLGIIDFASKKKYAFGSGKSFKMNPAFWDKNLNVTKGHTLLEALNDVNVHPKEYALACLAATLITMLGGGKSDLRQTSSSQESDWVPGDWGYIKNSKFSGADKDIGLEGENIIYVGKDSFWGHLSNELTYHSLFEWFNEVKSWNGAAEISDSRRIPTMGLQ